MIDQFRYLSDNTFMSAADKNGEKRATSLSPSTLSAAKRADLEFASANQQLEGFPGTITERGAAHDPDLELITRDAKRLGAQLPAEENLTQRPVCPITASIESLSKSA